MTNPCIGCREAWHAERNCNCREWCEKIKEGQNADETAQGIQSVVAGLNVRK